MASYHFSAQVISRSSGRSAVAAAAYRSRGELQDQRYGKSHNYSDREDLEHSEIVAPEAAPEWMRDREALWNGVEAAEKRKDAQLSREFEIALPRELTPDQRRELVRDFVQTEFVDRGMIADINIHNITASDGGEQPHAHIMTTMRDIDGDQFGKKNRAWNDKALLENQRESWASFANGHLTLAGHVSMIDHRSLEKQREEAERVAKEVRLSAESTKNEQAKERRRTTADMHEIRAIMLDREPQPRRGAADGQASRGSTSERLERWRETMNRNAAKIAERLLLHKRMKWLEKKAEQAQEAAREKAIELGNRFRAAGEAMRKDDVTSAFRRAGQAIGKADELAAENARLADIEAKRQQKLEQERAEKAARAPRQRGPTLGM